MKISKGKIILAVIVIYFAIFAIVNINKEKDINKYILDNVIYVSNGKMDKKNEGKIVLVSGKIKYDNLVGFIELKEGFGTIKIKRKVEDYIKYYDEYDKEYKYKWKEREKSLNGDYLKTILSEEKISDISIGDYKLDEYGLSLIPIDKYYKEQESIGELTSAGTSYSRDPWEEDIKEGDMKITYKYYDLDKHPYMSILAVQKGNSFTAYESGKTKVYQVFDHKVDSKKKLEKELKTNVKKTTKGKFLFIVIILAVGIFFIADNRKV